MVGKRRVAGGQDLAVPVVRPRLDRDAGRHGDRRQRVERTQEVVEPTHRTESEALVEALVRAEPLVRVRRAGPAAGHASRPQSLRPRSTAHPNSARPMPSPRCAVNHPPHIDPVVARIRRRVSRAHDADDLTVGDSNTRVEHEVVGGVVELLAYLVDAQHHRGTRS